MREAGSCLNPAFAGFPGCPLSSGEGVAEVKSERDDSILGIRGDG